VGSLDGRAFGLALFFGLLACGILHENKLSWKSAEHLWGADPAGIRIKIYFFDAAKTLVGRGFCKSGLRKI
jgi:hypothetical protein